MRLLLLLSMAWPLGAAEDVRAILERLIAAEKQNELAARQYTYLEQTTWFTFDRHDQPRKNRTETHDVIFVEGVMYRKLTARNGKPLSAREAAKVEREMRETAAERRRHPHTAAGGEISFGASHVDIGSLPELLTLFDCHMVGEDTEAWIVECEPRTGHTPASLHERDVLGFRKKLWIDRSENLLRKIAITVAGEGLQTTEGTVIASPGSSITMESEKIDDRVWEVVAVILDIQRPSGKTIRPWGRTEYRESRFQKFDVESTITVDPPK